MDEASPGSEFPWSDVPPDRQADWTHAFDSSREGVDLSAPCPLCGERTLHRYYRLGRRNPTTSDGVLYAGDGGLWEWCGACFAYAHYSCLVPLWWTTDLTVDAARLTALPTAIEIARRAARLPGGDGREGGGEVE